jgi:hypothetical protein
MPWACKEMSLRAIPSQITDFVARRISHAGKNRESVSVGTIWHTCFQGNKII